MEILWTNPIVLYFFLRLFIDRWVENICINENLEVVTVIESIVVVSTIIVNCIFIIRQTLFDSLFITYLKEIEKNYT